MIEKTQVLLFKIIQLKSWLLLIKQKMSIGMFVKLHLMKFKIISEIEQLTYQTLLFLRKLSKLILKL